MYRMGKCPSTKQTLKRYEVSLETRKFEIQLFWTRSLFFWGFIGAAFVAYANYLKNPGLSLVVAGFGLVCSFAWTLVNRGSKYWQENWEKNVSDAEGDITGELFSIQNKIQNKGMWLSARRYSVSKVAIALSDYVFLLWLFLLSYQIAILFYTFSGQTVKLGKIVFASFSFLYILLMLVKCRTSKEGEKKGILELLRKVFPVRIRVSIKIENQNIIP